MKTFEEVQSGMKEWERDCLMKTEDFLRYVENGSIISYDGTGRFHDGKEFVASSVFKIMEEWPKSKKALIKKYPYTAWYNR